MPELQRVSVFAWWVLGLVVLALLGAAISFREAGTIRQGVPLAVIPTDSEKNQKVGQSADALASAPTPPPVSKPWEARLIGIDPWPPDVHEIELPKDGAIKFDLKRGEWSAAYQKPVGYEVQVWMPSEAFQWWFSTGEKLWNPASKRNSLGAEFPSGSRTFRLMDLGASGKVTIATYKN